MILQALLAYGTYHGPSVYQRHVEELRQIAFDPAIQPIPRVACMNWDLWAIYEYIMSAYAI